MININKTFYEDTKGISLPEDHFLHTGNGMVMYKNCEYKVVNKAVSCSLRGGLLLHEVVLEDLIVEGKFIRLESSEILHLERAPGNQPRSE